MNDNRAEVIDLQEIWENLLRQFALEQENALPAVVTSYDRAKNLVTCRPAVNRLGVNGESQQRAEVVVPCLNPSGGGLGINFPLQEGDTGWLLGADRDTTNFQSTRAVADPGTGYLHRYMFGVFIPDRIHDFTINSDDDGALVLENLAATTRISIKDNRVKITRQNTTAEVNGFQIALKTPTSSIVTSDDGTVTIKATQTTIDGMANISTGATGVITLASVATVANGIVTSIS